MGYKYSQKVIYGTDSDNSSNRTTLTANKLLSGVGIRENTWNLSPSCVLFLFIPFFDSVIPISRSLNFRDKGTLCDRQN